MKYESEIKVLFGALRRRAGGRQKSLWSEINHFLSEKILDEVSASTMVGGATLTKLLGTSAWYAPGASVSYLVDSVLNNCRKIIPCSVMLEGEYGLNDICIGVPIIVGENGVEEIIDIKLDNIENEKLKKSALAVANMNLALNTILK